jgi:cell division septal protein FtsQ
MSSTITKNLTKKIERRKMRSKKRRKQKRKRGRKKIRKKKILTCFICLELQGISFLLSFMNLKKALPPQA